MFASVGVPAGVAVSVPEATSALAGAVDALLVVEASDVADDELRAAMVDLRRLQSQLAAAVTELTAEFDARRAWADDGSRNGADWLAFHAHRPRPEMASEVQVGRRLRTMPCVRDAWRAGDVSFAHARVLARLAGHPRAGAHFPEGEAALVGDARRLRFDDFERVTRYWLAAADPDGPERDRRRDHDLRRFSLAIGLDGVGHSDGRFTPLGAATVGGMLERIEDELFQTDLADARERLGDAATVADLRRTPPNGVTTPWSRWRCAPVPPRPTASVRRRSSPSWSGTRPLPGRCASSLAARSSPPAPSPSCWARTTRSCSAPCSTPPTA